MVTSRSALQCLTISSRLFGKWRADLTYLWMARLEVIANNGFKAGLLFEGFDCKLGV